MPGATCVPPMNTVKEHQCRSFVPCQELRICISGSSSWLPLQGICYLWKLMMPIIYYEVKGRDMTANMSLLTLCESHTWYAKCYSTRTAEPNTHCKAQGDTHCHLHNRLKKATPLLHMISNTDRRKCGRRGAKDRAGGGGRRNVVVPAHPRGVAMPFTAVPIGL